MYGLLIQKYHSSQNLSPPKPSTANTHVHAPRETPSTAACSISLAEAQRYKVHVKIKL
jgi:hypothetical protein